MDERLRTALLAIPQMPTDDDGNPPAGYTDRSPNGTMFWEFRPGDDGKVRAQLVLALEGAGLNKPGDCGRSYHFDSPDDDDIPGPEDGADGRWG